MLNILYNNYRSRVDLYELEMENEFMIDSVGRMIDINECLFWNQITYISIQVWLVVR